MAIVKTETKRTEAKLKAKARPAKVVAVKASAAKRAGKDRNPLAGAMDISTDGQRFRVPKTAELLARDLRNRIVRGELEDGGSLPSESELIAQFSVSRPTLREALRILESESLLTVTRGSRGGPRIHRPEPRLAARHFGLVLQSRGTTLAHIFSARLLIEPSCVRQVTLEARRTAPGVLREILEEEKRTVDDDVAHSRAAARFHRSLIELTGNLPLVLLMSMLTHIFERHIATAALAASAHRVDAAATEKGVRAHEKLISLIEAGNADAAEAYWREYLEGIDQVIRNNFPVDRVIDVLD
jgi:DNA-binding FadR family transcriptional regulator